jgi:hypothetical protein
MALPFPCYSHDRNLDATGSGKGGTGTIQVSGNYECVPGSPGYTCNFCVTYQLQWRDPTTGGWKDVTGDGGNDSFSVDCLYGKRRTITQTYSKLPDYLYRVTVAVYSTLCGPRKGVIIDELKGDSFVVY